jgi:hypothetical protein
MGRRLRRSNATAGGPFGFVRVAGTCGWRELGTTIRSEILSISAVNDSTDVYWNTDALPGASST